ncbi:MAG: bifunctional phosphopantothenoylcysteine decarboxylase/phosphopantothenate--cysteine ligase CoaBC [Deltaproteobacteria bacterium]|nr:bifunctional phosphopantothenoylcysteine decarboxylase/phosphopantothenate--cysteine ligase CoaBC [Deltaproteobacteria bacterium]
MIKGKWITLGVTGGIAAYKAVDLVRQLRTRGAEVDVIMTKNAQQFVTPFTFQTVSGHPVYTDLFGSFKPEISHISLAEKADAFIIAPATANIIAKIVSGLADDLLSTVLLATRAPVLIAPAMNDKMWENPVVKQNVAKLKELGFEIVEPTSGELACGAEGKGRLADIEDIVKETITILTKKDLKGERILITTGPTHEPIDPVRILTNRSSGKMGYALAQASYRRGAEVMLVSGPTNLKPIPHIHTISVGTSLEMSKAALKHYKSCSIAIKAAAVADYRPKKGLKDKMKKTHKTLSLELERNPDILYQMGKNKGKKILVGFAAETKNIISQAKLKLDKKNLDLIVVNQVLQKKGGFGSDNNEATLIDYEGRIDALPLMSKEELADKIIDKIKELKDKKPTTKEPKKTT